MSKNILIPLFLILSLISAQPGAYRSQDISLLKEEKNFLEVLEFGLTSLYGSKSYDILEIKSIETQVVAGLNYKILLLVSNTKTNEKEEVELIVNHQSWAGTKKLLKAERTPQVEYGSTRVGMWQEFPFNEQGEHQGYYGKSMMAIMHHLRQEHGGVWNAKNVLGVEQQVTAGIHYRIKIDAFSSEGLNKKVEVIVFAQPWKDQYDVVSVVDI